MAAAAAPTASGARWAAKTPGTAERKIDLRCSLFPSHPFSPPPVNPSIVPICWLAITAFALSGCGSDGGNLPKTVPASGVVTLDGKPVDGAQVVLVPPVEGQTGAYAVTD